jgi:CheY-like chemotaxis protein
MTTSRVLVVDDSLTIRRALELILKPLGHELDFAADGAQALERANAFAPDLILLDYVLPDMRAPDVCAALAATPATAFTPIILVSAKGASIRQAYQDAQNVVSYITKPFKPQVVASVVENALARGRGRDAVPEPARSPLPRSTVHAREADERPSRGEGASSVPPPASVEQAFAALLAQLEGAICEDAAARGNASRGSGVPGVSPRLRSAAERLNDVAQHLNGEAVVPYRLRSDGSFANVAATLLEAHRYLCEAAILLAATGAPSAVLPRAPEVLVVCPEHHALAQEIMDAARGRDLVALAIGDEFAQLPHLVRLLAPRLVVGVLRVDDAVDSALHASLGAQAPQTRFVAFGGGDGEIDGRFASRVHDVEALLALFAEVAHEARRDTEDAPDIDLEVVAI